MADNDEIEEKVQEKLLEDLKKTNEAYAELEARKKAIADYSAQELKVASAYQDTLNKINAISQEELKRREEIVEKLERQGKDDTQRYKSAQRQLQIAKAHLKVQKDSRVQAAKANSDLKKAVELESASHADRTQAMVGINKLTDEYGRKNVFEEQAFRGEQVLKGMGPTIAETFKQINRGFEQSSGLLLAKAYDINVNLDAVSAEMKKLPGEMDVSMRGLVKATALPFKQIGDTFTAAFDPNTAMRAKGLFRGISNEAKPLTSVGLKTKDIAGAISALVEQSALFKPAFMEAEPEAAAFTANLVAGLSKIGVEFTDSSKAFDFFTKSMKKSPIQASKSIKSIASIAKSLGLSTKQVFADFSAQTPILSQFGDQMTEVFGELQARVASTGTSMDSLVKIAMKMDTFEGAAKAATTLNAVLGDTAISVTDLVHADPDEKFRIIADAVNNSGVEFDSLNRRYKDIIATAAGFGSVAEFQKQLHNTDDIRAASDALDTNAMSQDDLGKKIEESLTSAELATKGVSEFAGGFAKVNEGIRKTAGSIALSVDKGFANILESTKNSATAVVQFGVAFSGAARTVGASIDSINDGLDKVVGLASKLGPAFGIVAGLQITKDITAPAPTQTPVNDLTILSDGRTFTADKQDNLFLRKEGAPAGNTADTGGETQIRLVSIDSDARDMLLEFGRKAATELLDSAI
jgi:hypothetical protein